MIRRPPRSTRTDTLFPYTTTSTNRDGVRRRFARRVGAASPVPDGVETYAIVRTQASKRFRGAGLGHLVAGAVVLVPVGEVLQFRLLQRTGTGIAAGGHVRSEERRVGKECVSTCRSRW